MHLTLLYAIMMIVTGFAIVWIFRLINEPEGDSAETYFNYKQQLKNKYKH